jgi:hypothetical protein
MLMQAKGFEHEGEYFQRIKSSGLAVVDLNENMGSLEDLQDGTVQLQYCKPG